MRTRKFDRMQDGTHTHLRADGTSIAYRVHGEDGGELPALVLSNGLTTSHRFWDHLLPLWKRNHRVLTWDLPGHGDSGPACSESSASIEGQPDIVAELMDVVGLDAAVQIGWSTGAQISVEMLRHHGARCLAVVNLLGGAGHVLDTTALPLQGWLIGGIVHHTPVPVFGAAIRALTRAGNTRLGHVLTRWTGLTGPRTRQQDVWGITEHLCRIHPATVQIMIRSAQVHSAHDLLSELPVPMLIVAGDVDPFAPTAQVGAPMHAAAPGSELLRLPEGTHTALLEHAPQIGEAVESFIARRVQSRAN